MSHNDTLFHPDLKRDSSSGAVINTNNSDYHRRRNLKLAYRKRECDIADLKCQVAALKATVDALVAKVGT